MMRATRAHLVFLRDRIPDDDLAVDGAAEAEDGGVEWLTNVRLEVLIARGQVDQARRVLDGFRPRRGSGTFQAALCDGLVDVLAGDLESGIEKAERHLHIARRGGDPRAIQGHSYVALLGLLLAGRLGDAAHLLYRTMSAARIAAFREIFHTGVLVLGSEIALSRGRVLRSRTLAAQALATNRGTGPYPGMDPSVFIGDDHGRESLGARLWELVAERIERGYDASAVLLATQAIGRLADPDAAARVREVSAGMEGRLLPAVGRFVDAASRSDVDELESVIADFRATGAHFFAVRTAVTRAIALRAAGRTEDAAVQADEAWVMSSVAGQERSGMFRHLVDDVALSPREREIAEMIARPMTTAEVADSLQMSVRTVETHLHNVGRKIGTSGRDQLVRAITTWLRPASV
jgi:DNA-binding CsgD family transcriptional regulator